MCAPVCLLASLIAQLVKNTPAMQETPIQFPGQEIYWRRDRLLIPVFLDFPGSSAGKECAHMQENWVQSLGWEDPLEKGMATHSNILAWRIPSGLQSTGSQRVGHNWVTNTFTFPMGDKSAGLQELCEVVPLLLCFLQRLQSGQKRTLSPVQQEPPLASPPWWLRSPYDYLGADNFTQ